MWDEKLASYSYCMDVRDLFSQIKIALGKMDVIVVLKKIGELKGEVPMLKKILYTDIYKDEYELIVLPIG